MRSDEPSAWALLLLEVERLPRAEDRESFRRLFSGALRGARVYICTGELRRADRLERAVQLLRSGVPARDVRRRIAVQFAVSKNTAARIVSAALRAAGAA